MLRSLLVLTFVLVLCAVFPVFKGEESSLQGFEPFSDSILFASEGTPRISVQKDGSIIYESPDGGKKTVAMEGFTPYGLKIKEERRVFRRGRFVLELVYSNRLSDDVMDRHVKVFFNEFARQLERWIYANKVPVGREQILVSNCRFCSTGYCHRKKVQELELIRVRKGERFRDVKISRIEILNKKKQKEIAAGAAESIMVK